MTNVEKKLSEMGYELPACPVPVAAYEPAQVAKNFIFVSGNTAFYNGKLLYAGKVGGDISIDEAYESAKISALRCISALASVADLDKVRILQVSGYINAVDDFGSHPKVLNGASELIKALFGEKGKHARKAIGSNSLPDNASVEIEMIAYLEE